MQQRPNAADCFMAIAEIVSRRATCPRAFCGAVIVKDGRVMATGYNGALSGTAHCTEVGCLLEDNHCQRAIHAEVNAIAQAAQYGIPVSGGQIYVYRRNVISKGTGPCRECMKVVMATNLKLITQDYNDGGV